MLHQYVNCSLTVFFRILKKSMQRKTINYTFRQFKQGCGDGTKGVEVKTPESTIKPIGQADHHALGRISTA